LPRFFCRPDDRQGDFLLLTGPEARHALTVLRLGPGDRLAVLDGSGLEYEAVIAETGGAGGQGETLRARIVRAGPRASEPSLDLHLLQGLPKGDKLDLIVQKATELGVRRIVPVVTERSLARPEAGSGGTKAARWRRIAQEAAKQAGRAVVPEIEEPRSVAEALAALPDGCALIVPWEEERRRTLAQAAARLERNGAAAVLIGPEGGLSAAEIAQVAAAGGQTVTLGPRLLRTETAGLAVLACLLFATGNLE
jgi:16S rRNA (uracil1498-N3)-methyltransferase